MVTTRAPQGLTPLQGFGVYMGGSAYYILNNADITTSGSQSDAIRTNDVATFFYANNLTIRALGSSADGINVASNTTNPYDALVYITTSANIETVSGVGARANNLRSNNNSVIILPSGSIVRVTGVTGALDVNGTTIPTASNASEAAGYAVYAGNRSTDPNDLIGTATVGNSYVFVGANSVLSSNMNAGHVVYANKGGLVQLGDGVSATANGAGAFALYAATERQGFSGATRPGYIYLEGGATLRANGSSTVIEANGAGSIIASKAIAVPVITPDYLNQRLLLNPSYLGALLNKTATTPTAGVFDVVGIMDARAGGEISLNMTNGSSFVGSTTTHLEMATASTINLNIDGAISKWSINANSTLSTLNLSSGATLEPFRAAASDLTSFSLQATASSGVTSNGGIINLQNPGSGVAGDSFTIIGNYTGSGGAQLKLDTVLGADGSPSDKLVISNGTNPGIPYTAAGNTLVAVQNVGGAGALTTANGILVVETINGATTAANSFTLANPELRAGAFDYRLFQGGLNGSDPDNWYLRSTFGVEPPGPTEPPPTVLPPTPPTPGPGIFPIIGPEIATYGVVQPMAQQLGRTMLGTHDERLGDLYSVSRPPCEPAETNAPPYAKAPVYTKAPTDCGVYGWRPAVWGRLFGQQIDNHYRAFADPRTDGQTAGLQVGFDVLRSDSLIAGHTDYAGVFAAYGNANVDVSGLVTNAAATGYVLQHTGHLNLNAYSGGAYWTHYGIPGWYIDLTLQGTSYGGAASTEFASLKTSGTGFISSIEGGYPIALPQLGPGFVLEPQAQVLWQWVSRLLHSRY